MEQDQGERPRNISRSRSRSIWYHKRYGKTRNMMYSIDPPRDNKGTDYYHHNHDHDEESGAASLHFTDTVGECIVDVTDGNRSHHNNNEVKADRRESSKSETGRSGYTKRYTIKGKIMIPTETKMAERRRRRYETTTKTTTKIMTKRIIIISAKTTMEEVDDDASVHGQVQQSQADTKSCKGYHVILLGSKETWKFETKLRMSVLMDVNKTQK